jgi:type I restriction enzyme, S subunit
VTCVWLSLIAAGASLLDSSPSEWNVDRLKDVAAINSSTLPADTNAEYEFDYLEISNVDYNGVVDANAIERIRFEDAPSRARRRVPKGSTIISSVRPNLQAAAFLPDVPTDFVCSTGFNVVQPIGTKLYPKFAYFALISEAARQYFEATAKGVGYPAVDDKDFNTFRILLPQLSEQKRIAAYLETSCAGIDTALSVKRQQTEILREVRESTIETAVTRGLRTRHMHEISEDWIERIPDHWGACRVKRVLSRMDYGISTSTERAGRFPVLKMGDIQEREINYSDLEFADDVPDDLLLEHGDLLYNRTNSPDQVGKAAIFRRSKADQIMFASYLVRLRTNHKADPHFLNYVLNSRGFLGFARKLAIPSVQQSNLNSTRYGRIFIPLPPVPEQREIVSFLDQKTNALSRIVEGIEKQINTLIAYRKSLIHECVTGQRRITDAEIKHAEAYA